MIRSLVTHTAAAICGAFSSYAFIQQFSQQEEKKEKDSDQKDLLFPKSILHPITIFQPNPNLTIAYNAQSKIPCYVVERISMDHKYDQNKLVSRSKIKQNFYEESTILPTHQRSRNSYFQKSGFDKGHLAPASNYRHSEEEMRDTFCLTNIAPQAPLVNRVIMSRLEEFTRNLVVGLLQDSNDDKREDHSDDWKEAYIITGPMFLPNQIIPVQNHRDDDDDYDHPMKKLYQYTFQGIGEPPSIVHVPTHFFKVVVTLKKTKGEKNRVVVDKFAAWVIPNSDDFFHKLNGTTNTTNSNDTHTINLQDFLVRPTDIEAVTGIRFFAQDDHSHGQIHIMDILTESVWSEQGKKSNVLLLSDGKVQQYSDQERYIQSKRKLAKNRKQLQDFDSHIPSHLCARGKCNHIIKIRKNNIPPEAVVGRT